MSLDHPTDWGGRLQEFPRTLVIRNWPFLLFLVVMGLVPAGIAWNPWLGGNPLLAAVVVIAVAAVVAIIAGAQVLAESLGAFFLAAIHENGMLTRRLFTEEFVTWDRIEKIELNTVSNMAGTALVSVPIFEIWVRGYRIPVRLNALLLGTGPAHLIASRAGVQITGAG